MRPRTDCGQQHFKIRSVCLRVHSLANTLHAGFAANMAVLSCLGLGAPPGSAQTSSSSGSHDEDLSPGPSPPSTANTQTIHPANHRVAIFSDELNHASIIDGARLAARAGCSLHVYRHNDLDHLDALLAATPPGVRKLVATDSLFSMDGDFADLRGLAALKRRCVDWSRTCVLRLLL